MLKTLIELLNKVNKEYNFYLSLQKINSKFKLKEMDPICVKTLKNVKIDHRVLLTPSLNEIKNVITPALQKNFKEISVEIVDCPDLTKKPFSLAAQGLEGNAQILEVGGPSYLLPSVQRNKVYDIQSILNSVNFDRTAFVIGAGAGPWPQLSRNCEMMMNVLIAPNKVTNETRLAWVDQEDQCVLQKSAENDTRFALLANLFISEGKTGKVIKVYAKNRIGKLDFIATMQKALEKYYTNDLVGLGGTFILKEGKVKQHVMPDFSSTPLNTEKSLNDWLNFYDMSAPLIAVGTFVSSETTDLDLRVQHFHSFSHHGEGGHYHIDTTPDTVEYLGYFNVANCLYRVDQPPSKVTFGKD
ncbi:ester hydrolase C11orf54 homolog [Chelonus insularis]|uniref:ester hydrolase C11orf54 homolog n=1 Tax=Chelonus insularis TaxID=460826 RepID=UPI00158C9B18|nr:ester hydrolase C11orf54 homolog [Chelonus insularis]XP_034950343.1 ester hydrolase C11orf54 homolog [Chelonus insularis]